MNKTLKSRIIATIITVVLALNIIACGNPIVAVDNAISPEGQNCGALVC